LKFVDSLQNYTGCSKCLNKKIFSRNHNFGLLRKMSILPRVLVQTK
jgi:hypothetical protein